MAKTYRVMNTLSFDTIIVQTILWIILSICTLGLATPFFAYYFVKIILNHTIIVEDD